MTIHQPFYELDKANMQGLYLLWTIAALIIVLSTISFIIMIIAIKIGEYRDKKRREKIQKADKEFYDNIGKTVCIGEGVDVNGKPIFLTKDEFEEMQKHTKKYEREIENE